MAHIQMFGGCRGRFAEFVVDPASTAAFSVIWRGGNGSRSAPGSASCGDTMTAVIGNLVVQILATLTFKRVESYA